MTTRSKTRRNGVDTTAPDPFSPATLPEVVLSLSRCELRDAADALMCARSRCNEAHEAFAGLSGDELRLLRDLDERASHTCDDAETTIGHVLLMIWNIAPDYEDARCGPNLRPWKPVGALIDDRWFCWIAPGEQDGIQDHSALAVRVRVIDLEDLEEDGLSDADWDRLLEKPPCRYVVLDGIKVPVVVEAECRKRR